MTLVTSPKLRSVLVFVALTIAASAQMTFYTHGQKTTERTAFIGVVDVIEGSDKDYYITFWSGDKLYSGKIGYDRLPIVLNTKIAGFLEANDLLANQKLKVCLANTVYEPVGMVNTENGVRKVTPWVKGDIVNLEFVSGPTDTVNNACRARTSRERTRTDSNNVKRTRPVRLSLSDEALKLAKETFGNDWIKCNDSYYRFEGQRFGGPDILHQSKEVTFETTADQITEVDRMNGIEWSGRVNVVPKFSRRRITGYAWGQWRKGAGSTITVRKGKSGWNANLIALPFGGRRPTCDEIAKIPEN